MSLSDVGFTNDHINWVVIEIDFWSVVADLAPLRHRIAESIKGNEILHQINWIV